MQKHKLDAYKYSDKLSPREQDVYELLCLGLEYWEVAEKLCISRTTVKTHVNNIFLKKYVNSHSKLLANFFYNEYIPKIKEGTKIEEK